MSKQQKNKKYNKIQNCKKKKVLSIYMTDKMLCP